MMRSRSLFAFRDFDSISSPLLNKREFRIPFQERTMIRSNQVAEMQSFTKPSNLNHKIFQSFQRRTYANSTEMFCFQCEQTKEGKGCTDVGVCGKTPETAGLQDLLIHQLKGISMYASRARSMGVQDAKLDDFMLKGLFSTVTNVNFDSARFVEYLKQAESVFKSAKQSYLEACKKAGLTPETLPDREYSLDGLNTIEKLEEKASKVGVQVRKEKLGPDVLGIQEMIVYGIKGLAAYADHAAHLGRTDPTVYKFIFDALDGIAHKNLSVDELLALAMKTGETNLTVMAMLEGVHNDHFGKPAPHRTRITAKKGKAILISGHDLKDLENLLKQTEGTGINVYTHGEMLPAHAYPMLNKYPHLAGNYGGPWQLQKIEFASFPGPIVMTSNCIIEPRKSYIDRIFTKHTVGWPGVKHVSGDYSEVIKAAQSLKGFEKDEPEKFIDTGFGKHTVLSVADKVINAVKGKQVSHFFFIGGCDGSEGERSYFKELALATPKDSFILTAGCGKYRFNKQNLGDIGGIPRVLDFGQCNDSYGAVVVAIELAKAFGTEVNKLPLSFAVSWFEQKAVAVLLTLLHLNVQNIRLGPNLPGFCTPAMLEILQKKFNIKPINQNIQAELKDMLAGK